MERFNLTFRPSECQCYVPLAILGVLAFVLLVIALVAAQPVV